MQGISEQTYHGLKGEVRRDEQWRCERVKQLQDENRKLKHVVAELALDNRALKDVFSKP